METVVEISQQRGIVSIQFDGNAVLKVRQKHFAMKPLKVGDTVAVEEYENAIAALQFSDAYEAALTSLDYAARTSREIERALIAKGYVAPAAEAVVERLKENHILDDRHLANRLAESSTHKPVGVYALRQKLRAKGISEEDAEEALEKLDEGQQRKAARQAGEKLMRKYQSLPAREARSKLSQGLARRGFSWDIIQDVAQELVSDDDFE